MTQKYEDKLNNFFKNKKIFYEEISTRNFNTKTKFCDTIIKLNELDYHFTEIDFDNFLNCALHNKGSLLTLKYIGKERLRDKILNILFNQHNPTDIQFDKILSCYHIINRNTIKSYHWIDIIIKKGHQFNQNQKEQILKIGYCFMKLYENLIISINDLKNILLYAFKGNIIKEKINFLEQIIPINQLNYPIDFLNYVLTIATIDDKDQLNIIILFLKYVKPNEETNSIIINKNILNNTLICSLFNAGLIPTDELMSYFSKNSKTIHFVFYMIKYDLKFSTDILNNLICKNLNFVVPYDIFLEKSCYKTHLTKFKISLKSTKNFLSSLGYQESIIDDCLNDNSIDIFKFFTKMDILPNELTLEIACFNIYISIFDKCTSKYKLIPNKITLDKILSKLDFKNKVDIENIQHLIIKILCYKIIPDKESMNNLLKSHNITDNYVELLIKYGLILTFDDIIKLLKKNIFIHNLERFNILYDGNLYFWCHIYDLFPLEYFNKFIIEKKILDLRTLCRNPKTKKEQLDLYLSDNNIKLDGYCLEMACKYNKNLFEHMFRDLKCKSTSNIFYWLSRYKDVNYEILEQVIEINKIDDNYLSKSIQD